MEGARTLNSIKNAFVTITMLAVGYGAYVVLSTPLPDELEQAMEVPVYPVTAPDSGPLLGTGAPTTPPAIASPGTAAVTSDVMLPPTQPASVETTPALDATAAVSDATEQSAAAEQAAGQAIDWPPPSFKASPDNLSPPTETLVGEAPRIDPQLSAATNPSAGAAIDASTAASVGAVAGRVAEAAAPAVAAAASRFASDPTAANPTSADPTSEPAVPAASVPAATDLMAASTQPTEGLAKEEPMADDAGNDPAAAEVASPFEFGWNETQKLLRDGQLADALQSLSAWYSDPSLTSEQSERCNALLDQLAGTVIYSQDSYLEPAYVVRSGDTLDSIAVEHGVSKEFLARINGLSEPYQLASGESLKVLRGPFRAEVSRSKSMLSLFLGNHYAGRFQVRLGSDLPASKATYEVAMIEPGREFFDRRSGIRVAADDPKNPYGNRWIGLRGDQVTTAHNVGIHADQGTGQEGCLAVSAADAEDLAMILSLGAKVTIKD
jgi:LysM repeat protein